MPSPVTPQNFKDVIPDPTGSKCEAFVRALIRLPVLIYKLVNYLLDSDGKFQVDFRRDLLGVGTYEFSAWELPLDGSRLLCNGSDFSDLTYPELAEAIGDIYGTPAGPNLHKLPDFRDRFPIGQSATKTAGTTGGEATHLLTQAELPDYALPSKCAQTTGDPVLNNGWGSATGANPERADPNGLSGSVGTGSSPYVTNAYLDGGETPMPIVPPWLSCFVYVRT